MGTQALRDSLAGTIFSKTRQAILALLYGHADESFFVNQIIQSANMGTGTVQRELKRLTEVGIITRQIKGNQVYYQANVHCPVFNELRGLIVKTAGLADVIRSSLAPIADRIKAAFIYGSFASGSENRASDVDLMIIGRVTFGQISEALSPSQEKLGRDMNFSVYSSQEFHRRMKEKDHFIKSVMEDSKIFVIGNADELARLTASETTAEALAEWLERREDAALLPVINEARSEYKKKGGKTWNGVQANVKVPRAKLAAFCRSHHIKKLSLFGSVLTGEFKPDSDVDVLVEFEPGHAPGWGMVSIEDELTSILGRKVDLHTKDDLSKYFRDRVVREAQVQYAAK